MLNPTAPQQSQASTKLASLNSSLQKRSRWHSLVAWTAVVLTVSMGHQLGALVSW